MTFDLRCYSCQEWVGKPEHGWAICSCRKLRISSTGKVKGWYSEFWNPDTELHIIHEKPRGN